MKRLFGNENTRHAPVQPESWEQMGAAAHVAAAAAAAGRPQPPSLPPFPYPSKYTINFAVASVGELWVPAIGYAVSFWDSTNATDLVQVRFGVNQGDQTGVQVPFRPGHALGLGDFTWIGLTWNQILGATGTLLFLPRSFVLDENH